MARFGMEVARFSPRQADLLLVAGTLTYKMAQVMTRLYDQMAEPKWVIAMGACASSGGMFRSYPVVQGIDEFMPGRLLHPRLPAASRRGADLPHGAAERRSSKRSAPTVWRFDTPEEAGSPLPVKDEQPVLPGRGEGPPIALSTDKERFVEEGPAEARLRAASSPRRAAV